MHPARRVRRYRRQSNLGAFLLFAGVCAPILHCAIRPPKS